MGARHPQETIAQLGADKIYFILAARHLIRQGVAK